MRKGMWSAAALVTLVAGAVVVFGAPSLRADTRVAMGSDSEPLKFLPAEITVPVGAKVEWFNETDLQHDVSAEDGSFDSNGLLGKGEKYQFTFSKAGDFRYFCTPHKDAGMTGVVKVTGAGTPTTVTTPTTQGGSTATTAAGGASTTTTTAKPAAGASSSTTTTAAANGTTTTTLAPSVTPTSGPDTAGETTTTTAGAHGGGEEAASDHSSEGGQEKKEKKKNSPIGIAFATVSTVLLAGIAGKLLASKS